MFYNNNGNNDDDDDNDGDLNVEIDIKIGNKYDVNIIQDFMSGEHGFSGLVFPQSKNLADFIVTQLYDSLNNNNNIVKNRSCIELGSGCGLPSIAASLEGGKPVIASDLPGALEHLNENVGKYNIITQPLCWGNEDDIELIMKNNNIVNGFDFIYGSDIFYSLDAVDILFNTISKLSHDNSIILICGIAGPSEDTKEQIDRSGYLVKYFEEKVVEKFHAYFVAFGANNGERQQLLPDGKIALSARCCGVWLLTPRKEKDEDSNVIWKQLSLQPNLKPLLTL